MTRRARTALSSLVLLGLAGGALAWAFYGVDRRIEEEQAGRERDEKVFAFLPDDVREVTVHAKGATTRLVRAGDGWRIAAPVEGEADAFAARSLVERIATLRRTREAAPAPGGDLARFGLAAPVVRIEVALDGGRTEALAVGDESGFDGAVFVRPTSGAVLVAPPGTRWALDRGPEDLRAKPKPPPAPAAAQEPAATGEKPPARPAAQAPSGRAPAEKPVDPAAKSP